MTTLYQWQMSNKADRSKSQIGERTTPADRRQFRRHDLERQEIRIDRVDAAKEKRVVFGQLVDISAGGVRIRAAAQDVRPDQQIRVRLELPPFAGICPFVDTSTGYALPKREWVGWMTVSRVFPVGMDRCEIAGRLVDMEEIDRGMLGLYLSTQPLVAA